MPSGVHKRGAQSRHPKIARRCLRPSAASASWLGASGRQIETALAISLISGVDLEYDKPLIAGAFERLGDPRPGQMVLPRRPVVVGAGVELDDKAGGARSRPGLPSLRYSCERVEKQSGIVGADILDQAYVDKVGLETVERLNRKLDWAFGPRKPQRPASC